MEIMQPEFVQIVKYSSHLDRDIAKYANNVSQSMIITVLGSIIVWELKIIAYFSILFLQCG